MASVQETVDGNGARGLRLSGEFRLETTGALRRSVLEAIRGGPLARVDLSEVDRLEGSAAAVLADTLCITGQLPEIVGANHDVQSILNLYTDSGQCPARLPAPPRVSLFVQVGRSAHELLKVVRNMLAFVAEASGAALSALRNPSSMDWKSVLRQTERHGADGLPIVAVIGSLMGLITAFQAAIQLHKLGADTFVAELVSLSLTRELAPLMTAIVVAGRSGAAIAAEVGTMKVSEEVDALHTLGICPHRYLVLPRMLALIIAVPLLTLLADLLGILAGAVVATLTLEVTLGQFLASAAESLVPFDIFSGLMKAAVFGGVIAGIAAERGLSARGGAVGVGRVTTAAVVSTLFWLVAIDALFALLFNVWGLQ